MPPAIICKQGGDSNQLCWTSWSYSPADLHIRYVAIFLHPHFSRTKMLTVHNAVRFWEDGVSAKLNRSCEELNVRYSAQIHVGSRTKTIWFERTVKRRRLHCTVGALNCPLYCARESDLEGCRDSVDYWCVIRDRSHSQIRISISSLHEEHDGHQDTTEFAEQEEGCCRRDQAFVGLCGCDGKVQGQSRKPQSGCQCERNAEPGAT